ncbi:MAG: sulfatase family protein [Acidimicrobiales bacterium]
MVAQNDESKQPNVLFIICDQLRGDHLGFAGNGVVRTPNIDRIASSGMVFGNSYVSNPVCMPSRSSIMTGRMPSAHGVVFNDRSLDPNDATFVRELRNAGWKTALLGKSHLQHGTSREAIVPLGGTPGRSSAHDAGWDTIEHPERYEAGDVPTIDDFYGFGHVEFALGHGAQVGGHHYKWALERGATPDQLADALDPAKNVELRIGDWWQIHPAPYAEEIHSTSFVTERTVSFIEGAVESGEPWLAWCSFPDPHHPMSPPEPWFSRHDPADMVLPDSFDAPEADTPAHLERLRSNPSKANENFWVLPFGPTADEARAAIAVTYGMVEAIDDGIGQILDTLDRLDLADDTIIVFTSDHGDMMGDHGVLLKSAMHYQGCVRTPLIIHSPGHSAGHTASLASNIDLSRTLLDLCGLDGYQGMQGRSLVPVLDDSSASVRDSVMVEEDLPIAMVMPIAPLQTRSVLTERYRYTRDTDGNEMLFDLVEDPNEVSNIAATNDAVRTEMLGLFADQMLAATDMTRTEPVAT